MRHPLRVTGALASLLLLPAWPPRLAPLTVLSLSCKDVPGAQERVRGQGRRRVQPAGVRPNLHAHARVQPQVRGAHVHLGAYARASSLRDRRLQRACGLTRGL